MAVLTTVRNGATFLLEAVESVLAQDFADFEYVFVDDGSTDETVQILEAVDDPRLRIVRPASRGRGAALNAGLATARAPLVAILDADDVALPGRLAVQHRLMREHPEVAALSAACLMRRGAATRPRAAAEVMRVVEPCELIRRTPIAHSATVLRRESVLALGGYSEDRSVLFDLDLWIRMAEHGLVLARIDATLVYKRLHRDQQFERRRRLAYVWATYRERRRAARLFARRRSDHALPLVGLLFGLIPTSVRTRLFRLSGE